MRIQTVAVLVAGLALIGLPGCERREAGPTGKVGDQKTDAKAGPAQLSSDEAFLTNIGECNLAETTAAKTALERASNPEVKKFAQKMLDDHGKVDSEAAALARTKGMTLPERPSDAHQKELNRLTESSGADFDRRYVAIIISDHVKGLPMLEETARTSTDPEIRAFAVKALPRCEAHLKTARELSGKLGGPPTAD
jgi:putative membrane protein